MIYGNLTELNGLGFLETKESTPTALSLNQESTTRSTSFLILTFFNIFPDLEVDPYLLLGLIQKMKFFYLEEVDTQWTLNKWKRR
jgi:hypothetical protein